MPKKFYPVIAFILLAAIISGIILIDQTPMVQAATFTKTWTTQGDFDSNAVTGQGATTKTSVDTAVSAGDVKISTVDVDQSFSETFTATTNIDTANSVAEISGGSLAQNTGTATDLNPVTAVEKIFPTFKVNEYTIGALANIVTPTATVTGTGPWTVAFSSAVNLSRIFKNDRFTDSAGLKWKILSVFDSVDKIIVIDSENNGSTSSPQAGAGNVGRWYASISAWEAGRQGDLVIRNAVERGLPYYDGAADTTEVTIDGWTTDATHYIEIFVPISERHNGKWDTGKYRMEVNTFKGVATIKERHVRIDGLQIAVGGDQTPRGIYATVGAEGAGSDVRISNNIIKNTSTVINYFPAAGIYSDTDNQVLKIWNNIVYDFSIGTGGSTASHGIYPADFLGSVYVSNNIVYNNYYGIRHGWNSTILKNNIANGNTTDYFEGVVHASSSNNISQDATSPNTTLRNKTVPFVDATNKDFHLEFRDGTGNPAMNAGTDLSADANLAFSTDIDNDARSSTWDIGADDVGATLVKVHSIGTASRDFSTLQGWENARDGVLTTRNVFKISGQSAAFTESETITGLTSGATGTYIKERDTPSASESYMTVDVLTGVFAAGETLTGGTSLSTATLSTILTTAGTIEKGEAYKDSTFTAGVTIDVSTTDATHYMWLTAEPGSRHTGVAGSGAKLIFNGLPAVEIKSDNTIVEWMEIEQDNNNWRVAIGTGWPSRNLIIRNNLIHANSATQPNTFALSISNDSRNGLIYNNVVYGYSIGFRYFDGGLTRYFYNNIAYGNGSGFFINPVNNTTANPVLRNNISTGNTTDYNANGGSWSASSSNNISSDATAPGTGSLINQTLTQIAFVSTTAGMEDLHILESSVAKNAGADLSATFKNDADSQDRAATSSLYASSTSWDIGADEWSGFAARYTGPQKALVRASNGDIYIGADNGKFGKYVSGTNTFTDLTSKISSFWGTNNINALTFDSTNNAIYLGGNAGKFAKYTIGTDTATDLTSKGTGAWGGVNIIALTFNSTNNAVYVGGGGASTQLSFSKCTTSSPCDGANGNATNLDSAISSFWGTNNIRALTFDSANNAIYLGGNAGKFAKYCVSTTACGTANTAYDLTAKISSFWLTNINTLAYDSANAMIYLGGDGGKFAKCATASPCDGANGNATDLSSKLAGSSFLNRPVGALTFDLADGTIYIGMKHTTAGFGKCQVINPCDGANGNVVDLTAKTSSFWGANNFNALAYDSANAMIYLGGDGGKFAKFTAVGASQSAQSIVVDTLATNIAYATLTKNDTVGTGSITYQLSNDNGTTFNTATPGTKYNFTTNGTSLKWKITITGNATVQDITIIYNGYNTTGTITNLKLDTASDAQFTRIDWTASTPSGTLVKFRTRGATNAQGSGALASALWSPYYTTSGATITNDAGTANPTFRYFEIEMFLDSGSTTGSATPTINDFTITYVQNGPPDFDPNYPTTSAGGISASQISDSLNVNWGKVNIQYSVRDQDTNSGTFTPGFIAPSFEYSLNNGSLWTPIPSGNLATGDTANKAVLQASYTIYAAIWDAKSHIPGNYSTQAKIRVTANDGEPVNNTVQAISAAFVLDTKNPVATQFKIDSRTDQLTLNFTDDANIQYRISNNSDQSADGLNSSSGVWQNVASSSFTGNPSWTLTGSPSYEIVWLELRDVYSNIIVASANAPLTPTNFNIKDVSNLQTQEFREFVSWGLWPSNAPVNAQFSKYDLYRSTDGINFSLLNTITASATNYYADFSVASNTTYSYKIIFVDTDGDISNYSSTQSDSPNGQGGTDVTAPTISGVAIAESGNTSARITWTTDELSDSAIEYSISPSTSFNLSAGSSSFVTSHELVVSGLTPSTNYLFRVKSKDIASNIGVNDNNGAGYSLITAGGPVVSNVTEINVTDKTATIFWNTNLDSNSFVVYSLNSAFTSPLEIGSAILVGGSGPTYQHKVDLANLSAATTYYYYVKSTDSLGNTTTDKNNNMYYSFRTALDLNPPIISNISTPVISSEAGVIVWTTDEPATSQVQYGGQSGSYTTTTTLDSALSINHVVSLTGLNSETNYYYKVKSKDAAGNETISVENVLKTQKQGQVVIFSSGAAAPPQPPKDTAPPVISEINIESIGAFEAIIKFKTDESSVAFIEYGKTKDYGFIVGIPEWSEGHAGQLRNLITGTEYHYKIKAVDSAGNSSYSDDQIFQTKFFAEALQELTTLENAQQFQDAIESSLESILPSVFPPFIQTPEAIDVTENSATIKWRTNVKTYSVVSYSANEEYNLKNINPYAAEVSDIENKVLDHQIILSNLKSNTEYHFMVKSFSLPQAIGRSPDIVFVTKAAKFQAIISDIKKDSFRVIWTTGEPTTSIVEYKNLKTNAINRKIDEVKRPFHDILIENLNPATTYEVKAFGYNELENLVETKEILKATTSKDVTPPEISSLKIDSALVPGRADRAQTIVSWKTDEPATSIVFYEEGSSKTDKEFANKIEISNSWVLDHTVILTNLRSGKIYRIQISSVDQAGNKSIFPIRTIITPRQTESILDVIFKNFEETFKFLRKIR
ncbi:MAG: hypothetical protein HYV52_00365 [Parcubacteria group bacterium]|nr:hypothetical protein [Parcubacteria group bacterium]